MRVRARGRPRAGRRPSRWARRRCGPGPERPGRHPHAARASRGRRRRRATVLVDQHVRVLLGDEHVARTTVELEGDLVGHRRGREEQGGFLTEERRDPRFEPETVGSSRFCSSPTTASAIARRMPGVGCVAVSERRSITPRTLPSGHGSRAPRTRPSRTAVNPPTARGRSGNGRGVSSYEGMTTLPKAPRRRSRRTCRFDARRRHGARVASTAP